METRNASVYPFNYTDDLLRIIWFLMIIKLTKDHYFIIRRKESLLFMHLGKKTQSQGLFPYLLVLTTLSERNGCTEVLVLYKNKYIISPQIEEKIEVMKNKHTYILLIF